MTATELEDEDGGSRAGSGGETGLAAAVREGEHRLRAMSDNLPGGLVYQIDSGPDGGERRFTYLSGGVERLHEITAAAAMEDPSLVYGQVVEEDLALVVRRELAALETMSPFSAEVRVKLPSGRTDWRLFTSAPRRLGNGHIVWDGIEIDINERKRVELEVREIQAQLEATLEAIPDLWFEIDRRGAIRSFNVPDPGKLFASPDAFLGRPIREVLPPDAAAVIERALAEAETTGRHLGGVYSLPLADGPAWFELSVARKDLPGDADGYRFIALARDITDRTRAAEERERLGEQLAQAQKMESVGRLAGGVAHDFNNMLGVILGHTELALDKVAPDSPLAADLHQIRLAAERSADLTRQLLGFARKQTVAPRVLDPNETIGGILKMLRRIIGEDIDLIWIPGERVGAIKMDPSQIDQIMANLCVNSRDAIAETGRITIETDETTLDEALCAGLEGAVPGEYVRLSVSDDGCGMDQETLRRVFEPFFSTKETGKGTGLGLSTVYGIVRQNDGFINAYSEPGRGTTFRIYLPRHAQEAAVPRKEGHPEDLRRGAETILLVEDEPVLLKMTRRMLEVQGYSVLAASTPGEAIRAAREHDGEIHLLMTDVIMPEMNGRDLAARVVSTTRPAVRLLFMSGYTSNVIAHHGVLDEGVHFIQKPFSLDELTSMVREALDG